MPRSFDMTVNYERSVEDVHRAFGDLNYWEGRLGIPPVDVATLECMRVGDNRIIEVVTLQTMLGKNLPGLVTQLHRGDLSVRREETWSPITNGTATAAIAGAIVNAPVNLVGTAVLSPVAESGGAELAYRVSVQVRVPIIGGKLEKLIGHQLRELIVLEHRFTTEWIANNA